MGRAAILWLAILLAACTMPARAPVDATPLVWPEPPEAPRIAFVESISRPEDLGISRGWLERLGELFLGAQDKRLVRPMAVVATATELFVADPGAGGVHRFDRASGRYDLVRLEKGAAMRSPVALAAGPKGDVYVTDSARREVLVIRAGARHAASLGLAGFTQPTGIAYDAVRARLYIVDTAADRVDVLDANARPLASFGRRGSGPGEFNRPTHIWCDGDGRILVTDALNYRVQVFDADGRFVREFGQAGDASGDFMRHKGVATDVHGHAYVVDALLGQLDVFDGEGRLLLALGNLGSGRGEFWLPAGVFVAADDRIYVADSFNSRVQVLRYVGGAP